MLTIKLLATLRDMAGGVKTLDVPSDHIHTARDLAHAVCEANPALGSKLLNEEDELTGMIHILVNGRNIEWLEGLDTPVCESDILVLLPPAAGG